MEMGYDWQWDNSLQENATFGILMSFTNVFDTVEFKTHFEYDKRLRKR